MAAGGATTGRFASVRLVFSQASVVRPRDVATLLMDLETVYLLASGQDITSTALASPSWYPAEPYWDPHQLVLKQVNFSSPLQTVLEVPLQSWATTGGFFAGGVS